MKNCKENRIGSWCCIVAMYYIITVNSITGEKKTDHGLIENKNRIEIGSLFLEIRWKNLKRDPAQLI